MLRACGALLICSVALLFHRRSSSGRSLATEWEKTVQAAKNEGQVTVYVHSTYAPVLMSGAFEKAFPDIKLQWSAASKTTLSGALAPAARRKISRGRVHGRRAAQQRFHAGEVFGSIKPVLLLPEVVDESEWWHGKHTYSDPEKQYLFRYVASAQLGQISYNTQFVQPKEFTSFWDFLKPKWKGKILARDIRLPGTGGSAIRLFYYSPEMGPEFVRKLFGETDITLFRDRRQGLDWLSGKIFHLFLV